MTIHRTSNGKIARGPGGDIQRAPSQAAFEECCCIPAWKLIPCIETVSECGLCTDSLTPKYLTASFNLALCTDCWFVNPSGQSRDWATPPSINMTVRLAHDNGCYWRSDYIACAGTWNTYSSTDCSGSGSPTSFSYIRVSVAFGSDTPDNRLEVKITAYTSGYARVRSIFYAAQSLKGGACPDCWTYPGDDCTTWDFTATDCNAGCTFGGCYTYWGFAAGNTVHIVAGDHVTANARCPGGDPYYTDSDLSAYVGDAVWISEDSGICYKVTANSDDEIVDGTATVTNCWTTCTKCCDDDTEDC